MSDTASRDANPARETCTLDRKVLKPDRKHNRDAFDQRQHVYRLICLDVTGRWQQTGAYKHKTATCIAQMQHAMHNDCGSRPCKGPPVPHDTEGYNADAGTSTGNRYTAAARAPALQARSSCPEDHKQTRTLESSTQHPGNEARREGSTAAPRGDALPSRAASAGIVRGAQPGSNK